MTTRRELLKGLFGAAVIAALPQSEILKVDAVQVWADAAMKVYQQYMNELVAFGTAGIRQIETFPYIEVVSAKDMYLIPELYRSSGEY